MSRKLEVIDSSGSRQYKPLSVGEHPDDVIPAQSTAHLKKPSNWRKAALIALVVVILLGVPFFAYLWSLHRSCSNAFGTPLFHEDDVFVSEVTVTTGTAEKTYGGVLYTVTSVTERVCGGGGWQQAVGQASYTSHMFYQLIDEAGDSRLVYAGVPSAGALNASSSFWVQRVVPGDDALPILLALVSDDTQVNTYAFALDAGAQAATLTLTHSAAANSDLYNYDLWQWDDGSVVYISIETIADHASSASDRPLRLVRIPSSASSAPAPETLTFDLSSGGDDTRTTGLWAAGEWVFGGVVHRTVYVGIIVREETEKQPPLFRFSFCTLDAPQDCVPPPWNDTEWEVVQMHRSGALLQRTTLQQTDDDCVWYDVASSSLTAADQVFPGLVGCPASPSYAVADGRNVTVWRIADRTSTTYTYPSVDAVQWPQDCPTKLGKHTQQKATSEPQSVFPIESLNTNVWFMRSYVLEEKFGMTPWLSVQTPTSHYTLQCPFNSTLGAQVK